MQPHNPMTGGETVQAQAAVPELPARPRAWWKHPLVLCGAGVIVAGGAAGAAWLRHYRTVSVTTTPDVVWVTAAKGNVTESVSLSGTLEPANTATLTASEPVLNVLVSAGQAVHKGQVIARLDDSSLQLQLRSANAQLAAAKAKLAEAQAPAANTTAALAADAGGRAALSPGAGQARQASPDPSELAQLQAQVEEAQAQVDQIEHAIAACTVRSPMNGTVLQVGGVSGGLSSASAGTASGQSGSAGSSTPGGTSASALSGGTGGGSILAVIADLSPDDFVVQANVAQADIADLRIGQRATVTLSAATGPTLTGKVASIGYMPQSQGGVTTYPVTIRLDPGQKPGVQLLPGESAAVSVVEKSVQNVLTIPTAAVTQRFGVPGVYVNADQAGTSSDNRDVDLMNGIRVPKGLVFQPIQLGLYGGNVVQVKSGLTAGEQVAVVVPQTTGTAAAGGSGSLLGASLGGRTFVSGGFTGFGGFAGFGGRFGGDTGHGGYSRFGSAGAGGGWPRGAGGGF
ncbi:MAG: HlyD family efflux transporter periplasmic adaptor subunit [Alicyclobacillaceae bacterium]|nr:HlyD family efflux transporter periplasmic adaptor subunit [Alicyclobacillaceae bacterium]